MQDMEIGTRDINSDAVELAYKQICRICLQFSKEMNNLFTIQLPRDSLNLIVFLRRITGLEVKIKLYGNNEVNKVSVFRKRKFT